VHSGGKADGSALAFAVRRDGESGCCRFRLYRRRRACQNARAFGFFAMHDIKLIRDNAPAFIGGLARRGFDDAEKISADILARDHELRALQTRLQEIAHKCPVHKTLTSPIVITDLKEDAAADLRGFTRI